MLKITTGIENARAAKYLREVFEAALIKQFRPGQNIIKNPVGTSNRLLKYADPVQAGIDKLLERPLVRPVRPAGCPGLQGVRRSLE